VRLGHFLKRKDMQDVRFQLPGMQQRRQLLHVVPAGVDQDVLCCYPSLRGLFFVCVGDATRDRNQDTVFLQDGYRSQDIIVSGRVEDKIQSVIQLLEILSLIVDELVRAEP
jgi:hypothetical protein